MSRWHVVPDEWKPRLRAHLRATCGEDRDRLSAYEQWDLSLDRALFKEYEHGIGTIHSGETREGAKRFAGGRGRGGRFDDL